MSENYFEDGYYKYSFLLMPPGYYDVYEYHTDEEGKEKRSRHQDVCTPLILATTITAVQWRQRHGQKKHINIDNRSGS